MNIPHHYKRYKNQSSPRLDYLFNAESSFTDSSLLPLDRSIEIGESPKDTIMFDGLKSAMSIDQPNPIDQIINNRLYHHSVLDDSNQAVNGSDASILVNLVGNSPRLLNIQGASQSFKNMSIG